MASLPANDQADPQALVRSLWDGSDMAFYTALLENLETVGIHYVTDPLSASTGSHIGTPYPLMRTSQLGYQISVFESDLQQARTILESLLDQEPENAELPEPAADDTARTEETSQPQQASGDEDPTLEIWSGPDDTLAGFVRDALLENEIPLREESSAGLKKIYVPSSDARRAKEIVREVSEASPPQ